MKNMSDINEIRQAQIRAGENAVIESLKAKGLIPNDEKEPRNEKEILDFAQWYSGMSRDKVKLAYQRYLKENK